MTTFYHLFANAIIWVNEKLQSVSIDQLKPTFLLGDAAHVPAGPLSQPSPTNSTRTTPFWLQDLLARLSDYVIFSSRVLVVHGGGE